MIINNRYPKNLSLEYNSYILESKEIRSKGKFKSIKKVKKILKKKKKAIFINVDSQDITGNEKNCSFGPLDEDKRFIIRNTDDFEDLYESSMLGPDEMFG